METPTPPKPNKKRGRPKGKAAERRETAIASKKVDPQLEFAPLTKEERIKRLKTTQVEIEKAKNRLDKLESEARLERKKLATYTERIADLIHSLDQEEIAPKATAD